MAERARCYLESVRKSFSRLSSREKRFLRDFEDSVRSFEEEHPEKDEDAFAEEFGTPQEIVQDFYDHSGLELYREMYCRHRSSQKGSAMVACIVAAMLAMPFAVMTPPCVHQVNRCITNAKDDVSTKISMVYRWEAEE